MPLISGNRKNPKVNVLGLNPIFLIFCKKPGDSNPEIFLSFCFTVVVKSKFCAPRYRFVSSGQCAGRSKVCSVVHSGLRTLRRGLAGRTRLFLRNVFLKNGKTAGSYPAEKPFVFPDAHLKIRCLPPRLHDLFFRLLQKKWPSRLFPSTSPAKQNGILPRSKIRCHCTIGNATEIRAEMR